MQLLIVISGYTVKKLRGWVDAFLASVPSPVTQPCNLLLSLAGGSGDCAQLRHGLQYSLRVCSWSECTLLSNERRPWNAVALPLEHLGEVIGKEEDLLRTTAAARKGHRFERHHGDTGSL